MADGCLRDPLKGVYFEEKGLSLDFADDNIPGFADEEEPKTDDELDDFEFGPGYFSGSSPLYSSDEEVSGIQEVGMVPVEYTGRFFTAFPSMHSYSSFG